MSIVQETKDQANSIKFGNRNENPAVTLNNKYAGKLSKMSEKQIMNI